MQQIELYATIASAVLGLLFTTVTYILKFIKSEKSNKLSEYIIQIRSYILPLIKQAEAFANLSGSEKLEFVMSKLSEYAQTHNMPFDEEIEHEVQQNIEEIVALTKVVNIDSKSHSTAPV